MLKKTAIATIMLSSLVAQQSLASCFGNVYSLNAGRGHVGILVDIQESDVFTGNYSGDRALAVSRTAFSASAMTYDRNNDRIYYVSSPRPSKYHVQGLENLVSEDEFNNLDFHAFTQKNQLAYYDPKTGGNIIVADVPATFRMAFDPNDNLIYASDNQKIFTIDPVTGESTDIAEFSSGIRQGGFSSWGDFLFHKGELLFITNGRTFIVNKETGAVSLKAFHFTDFITSATLDQNGQVLIAAKNQNVTGNVNSTHLYRFNPETGERVTVGLVPARLSAMATNTSETYNCYPETLFKSDLNLSVTEVSDVSIEEGNTAAVTISFDKKSVAEADLTLTLRNETALLGADFDGSVVVSFEDGSSQNVTLSDSATTLTIPAGNSSITVNIPTIDNEFDEADKAFFLDASLQEDNSDLSSAKITIVDEDIVRSERLPQAGQPIFSRWQTQGTVFQSTIGGLGYNRGGTQPGGVAWQDFSAVSGETYNVTLTFWAHSSGSPTHTGTAEIIDLETGEVLANRTVDVRGGQTVEVLMTFDKAHSGNLRLRVANPSSIGNIGASDLVLRFASVFGATPS
ncbi:hypothetical protein [Enterovibrio baiacu]|uniref:hypothetical protein n=1 Tax=Enterovibrio baiacu TaxID=2491023 RepID=UPI0010102381|nr:hypothetical protein [Enterovibrio baiacu]MBE1276520.1 hypothetical protein [Enterovibrio baiacu]